MPRASGDPRTTSIIGIRAALSCARPGRPGLLLSAPKQILSTPLVKKSNCRRGVPTAVLNARAFFGMILRTTLPVWGWQYLDLSAPAWTCRSCSWLPTTSRDCISPTGLRSAWVDIDGAVRPSGARGIWKGGRGWILRRIRTGWASSRTPGIARVQLSGQDGRL